MSLKTKAKKIVRDNKAKKLIKDKAMRVEEITPDFPSRINIEPTNRCNLRCNMCPRQDLTRPVGDISMDLFDKLAQEISRHPPAEVRLHKDGEPLKAPHIFDLIDHIKTVAPSTLLNMDTNALLLDEEKAERLLDSKLDVLLFSVNAATPETYRQVRGSTKYDQVIANIERFLAMRKERGYVWPRVKVQLIVMAETRNEIGLFKEKWGPHDVDILLIPAINWGGHRPEVKSLMQLPARRYPCGFLFNSFSINYDGKVSFCNVDFNHLGVIGDVNGQTIEEIWKGPEFEHFRRLHKQGRFSEIDLCRDCNYWAYTRNVWYPAGKGWK
ncbi:MAG: radical SAM protein [Thermoleophilia bacterium]|nr:radical SAM protein [Thermoleophilia bacterium]